MKMSKCLSWLFWNALIVWMLSSQLENGYDESLFDCFYNYWCNPSYFKLLRNCWLVLTPSVKQLIRECTMSTCRLNLPEYFAIEEICGEQTSLKNKKECFFVCGELLVEYVERLLAVGYYSDELDSLINARRCIEPLLSRCESG